MPQEHQKHSADICEASSASAARSEGGEKKSGQVFDFSLIWRQKYSLC